jgi:STE24 endopeptidase
MKRIMPESGASGSAFAAICRRDLANPACYGNNRAQHLKPQAGANHMTKRALLQASIWLAIVVVTAVNPVARARQAHNVAPAAEQQQPAGSAAGQPAAAKTVTAYTLPPELYKKARNLNKARFTFEMLAPLYGLVVLWLVLQWRLAPKYRNWAENRSGRRILQALIFAPLILLTIDVLELPTGILENWELRRYGLSVQGWGSWSWDWVKGEIVSIIIGTILLAILYAVIRKSPRRWWLYFWAISLPIGIFLIFLQPLVIDPLFHKFGPLQQKDPALTTALEKMVQRAGKNIPPERMFWMNASQKVNELNAYVTGIGGSKRIVVWDTTIAKMTTPQVVFVVGHEMGHYVLNHIPKEVTFLAVGLFVFFYLGYRLIGWVLKRWGERWEVRSLDDWASLPALLLLLGILSFIASPIEAAVSRHFEHQADQYGLEVTHGLTPNSRQVAAQSFQVLGEVDLSDPDPSRIDILLTYDHPSIPERIWFALHYDPWANGGHGQFVH